MSTTGGQCLLYNGTVCKDFIPWSTTWVKDPSEDYQPWSSQRDLDKLEEDLKRKITMVSLTLSLALLPSNPDSLTLNLRPGNCSVAIAQKVWSRAFAASCSLLASRRPQAFTSPDLAATKHVNTSTTLTQGRAKIIYQFSDPWGRALGLLYLTVKLTPLAANRVTEHA
jgi:hypothetical protein